MSRKPKFTSNGSMADLEQLKQFLVSLGFQYFKVEESFQDGKSELIRIQLSLKREDVPKILSTDSFRREGESKCS